GFEPVRPGGQGNPTPPRLPVPPHGHKVDVISPTGEAIQPPPPISLRYLSILEPPSPTTRPVDAFDTVILRKRRLNVDPNISGVATAQFCDVGNQLRGGGGTVQSLDEFEG